MRSLTEAWKEIVTSGGHFSYRPSYQDPAWSPNSLSGLHRSTRFGTEGSGANPLAPTNLSKFLGNC